LFLINQIPGYFPVRNLLAIQTNYDFRVVIQFRPNWKVKNLTKTFQWWKIDKSLKMGRLKGGFVATFVASPLSYFQHTSDVRAFSRRIQHVINHQ
jgi:hypothetical protein